MKTSKDGAAYSFVFFLKQLLTTRNIKGKVQICVALTTLNDNTIMKGTERRTDMKSLLLALFITLVSLTACNKDEQSGTTEAIMPQEFVILADAVPDIIQEIRYYSTYNFVGERIDGYEEPVAIMTKEAAKALKEVSDDVKTQGYRLKVYDSYRPQCAVNHFIRWAKEVSDTLMKPYFYPLVDKSRLFELDYICAKSGHSRGSTVDLTLFDMTTEKEVDMGGTFDYFGELSHPDYKNITPEQYRNRMILREAMMKHGFNPFETEWWHFTLKDEPYPDTYFNFPVKYYR